VLLQRERHAAELATIETDLRNTQQQLESSHRELE